MCHLGVCALKRLGKNLGGYFGERIDIDTTLGDIATLAGRNGWEMEKIPAAAGIELLVLRRRVPQPRRRIYISSGIHGDEPAGPLAMRQLLADDTWPDDADLWVCPCLNPRGFRSGARDNTEDIDLNRDYRDPVSAEVRAHKRWLERQPDFDFALCLHEDWEAHGFYVYEINPDGRDSLARRIIAGVEKSFVIDRSLEIDGWPARDGIIVPTINLAERPLWPEALYLFSAKTRCTCTLEAPSDFALPLRVAALVIGVRAALQVDGAGSEGKKPAKDLLSP